MSLLVGADISLNHGALVDVNGNVLYEYTTGNGNSSTFLQLHSLARKLVIATPHASVLCIDWDHNWGLWDKKPLTASLICALVHMYATLALEMYAVESVFIAPWQVRKCLGLREDTGKSQVHEAADHLFPDMPPNKWGDIKDAWLLTYVMECAIQTVNKWEK